MLLDVAHDKPVGHVLHGQLAQGDVATRPDPFHLLEARPAVAPARDPDVDSSHELPNGQGPIALDQAEADLVRGDPSERIELALVLDEAFRFAEPVPEHLTHVGEDFSRSPDRLRRMIEPLGKLPWSTSLERSSEVVEPGIGGGQPGVEVVIAHAGQFGT